MQQSRNPIRIGKPLIVALCAAALVVPGRPALADLEIGIEAWERGDYVGAYREWKPLAEDGDPLAQYFVGTYCVKMENYGCAASWYRKAAENGDPYAQHDLGSLYALGLGVPKSDGEAARWYRLAAEQDHPMAQYNLGASYFHGEGVEQSFTRAANLFRSAALKGIAMAQHNLGTMYLIGQGVPQNEFTGAKWVHLAAKQTAEGVMCAAGAFEKGAFGRRLPVFPGETHPTMGTYREGITYVLGQARLLLGRLYEEGIGLRRDQLRAHKWFSLAEMIFPPGERRGFAREVRGALETRMTRDEIAESQRSAQEWSREHEMKAQQCP
jgi:hypothetical protein